MSCVNSPWWRVRNRVRLTGEVPAGSQWGGMRYGLFILLCLQALLASAVEFDEHLDRLPLGPLMYVFEDVRGDATITDIASPALQGSFRQHHNQVLNAGYSHSVFWLRIDLQYSPRESGGARPWYLELAYPPLDHLELYLPNGAGGYELAQRTGDRQPFASRQIKQ